MARKILFDISNLNSKQLQGLANAVDLDSRKKYRDGKIDEKEAKKLRDLLNGRQDLKAELENESNDIKNLMGYTSTKAVSTAPAPTQQAEVTPTVPEAAAASQADENKSKYEIVKEAYYNYRGIDPISRQPYVDEDGNPVQSLSPQAAYEAVKEDYKDNKEYKKALKELKHFSIDTEAKFVALDAISQSNAQTSKKVKKDAKQALGDDLDKHTRKALNGKSSNKWSNTMNWASLKDSDMKKLRKAQAYGNKAEDRASKTYTKKDFTDAIGKRCPLFKEDDRGFMAIEKLTDVQGCQLVTRKDGKFDISQLSAFISSQIGADNTMNRQQNKADAELEAIRAEFRRQGVELTKRDTKQLVEFCGFKVEKKGIVKMVYDSTLGAVAGALGAAGAMATQRLIQRNNLLFRLETTEQNANFACSGFGKDLQGLIDAGAASVTQGSSYIEIRVNQEAILPFIRIAKNHILMSALKGAAIGAAVGLVASMMSYGPSEEDIFSTRFECRTYEEFLDYVDARKELNDAQKAALKQIAFAYTGDEIDVQTQKRDAKGALVLDNNGKPIIETKKQLSFNCEGFKDYLNEQAGYKSNLNSTELLKAVKNTPKNDAVEDDNNDKKIDDDNDDDDNNDERTTPVVQENVYISSEITRFDKFNNANKYSWPDLVKMYDCISDKPYNVQSRFLKVMQGMKQNTFTYEQIMQIVEISRPGLKINNAIKEKIKALDFITEDNFDVDMFAAHVNTPGAVGDDGHQIIALSEIKDNEGNVVCTRDDSKVTRTIDKNAKKGKVQSKGRTSDGETTTYWHRDKEGKVDKDKDKDAQNNWVRSQGPNVKVNPIAGGRRALEEL